MVYKDFFFLPVRSWQWSRHLFGFYPAHAYIGTLYIYIYICIFYASARLDNNGKGVFAFSSPYAHHHRRGKQKYIHTVRRIKNTYYILYLWEGDNYYIIYIRFICICFDRVYQKRIYVHKHYLGTWMTYNICSVRKKQNQGVCVCVQVRHSCIIYFTRFYL